MLLMILINAKIVVLLEDFVNNQNAIANKDILERNVK
jgi:hypothetical protein